MRTGTFVRSCIITEVDAPFTSPPVFISMHECASFVRILAGNRLLMLTKSALCTFSRAARTPVFPHSSGLLSMSCLSISGLTHSPTKNRGQIQVILGPMFSGKSTELMRRIKRYQVANHECLLIKYAKDARYSDEYLSTHDKHMLPAVKAEKLSDISIPNSCSVIGIDEGQFFSDIVEFCEGMANDGVRVIVSALDGTFQRKAFGSILGLIPLAESVVKLNAVCMVCYGEAAFTKRIGSETQVEVIGGSDKYMAVCRTCHQATKDSLVKSGRMPLGEVNQNRRQILAPTEKENVLTNASLPRKLFKI